MSRSKTPSPIAIEKLTQIIEKGFAAVAEDIAESKKATLEGLARVEERLYSIEQELKDIKRRLTNLEDELGSLEEKHKREIEELWRHVAAIEKRLKKA